MSEESLEIKEILAGSKDKYFQIIDRYRDKLFAVAYHMSASEAEAEKIIENGFVEVYQSLEKYDDSVFFSDWLYEQFIQILGVKRDKDSIQQAKLPFHNPHYIEMEEAIQSLASEAKFQFLLIKLLEFSPAELSGLIGTSKEVIEENYFNALNQIRRSTLSNDIKQEGEDCHSEEELSLFFDGKLSGEKERQMEEHLEFCPDCREVLHFLKQEESTLEKVLEYPKLNESFNDKVLRKLVPYVPAKPKHRTWKYQLSAVGILAAIFLFSVVILPTLKPFASMVSTYMEHGTIYNVWTEGTYAVTNEEITLEITKVEIDSLYMAVYYEISREGEEKPKTFPLEEVEFYSYNPLKIVDEEGKQYPVEATIPDHLRYERDDGEEGKGKERPYYLVKMPEDLPDQFNLEINFSRLQGQYGKWNLEIPIRYDKVEDTAVTVKLDKTMNIDDKAVVEIMDVTYSKIGSRIRYKVNHTKEEEARLMKLLKEHDQEYRMQEILQGRHVGLLVTTEEDHYVLPNYFHYMDPYNSNGPVEIYFSNYYIGNDEQIQMGRHQIEGKIENPMEELYIKMLGASFQEPTFFSMEVPLEETESTPLEGTISSYKLLDYSLTPVKDGAGNITKYALIINGENQQKGASGDIGWELSDQSGNYMPTEGWYHYEDMQKEGVKKLLHVDIVTHNTGNEFPEKLVIKADYIYTHYDEKEWEKIPLLDEEEKNDSESE